MGVEVAADSEAFRALRAVPLFQTIDDEGIARLASAVRPVTLRARDVLFRYGEAGDALYVVLSGRLGATGRRVNGEQYEAAKFGAGDLVGEIEFVAGGPRAWTVVAEGDSTLVELPRAALEEAADQETTLDEGGEGGAPARAGVSTDMPGLMGRIALLVLERMRHERLAVLLPNVLGGKITPTVAAELRGKGEWISLRRGEALFRQGDPGDALFLVLSGRLRVIVRDASGAERAVGEVAPGETVGEMALISNAPRGATPVAIRDTELVKIGKAAFDAIVTKYPDVMLAINRVLVDRVVAANTRALMRTGAVAIAVAGTSPAAPVADVAKRLETGLATLGRTLRVDAAALRRQGVISSAAKLAEDHPTWMRFLCWIEEQLTKFDYIVLETDPRATSWTSRALRQCDHVVLVARADADPAPGEIERNVLDVGAHAATGAPRSLVLVQDETTRLPEGTARWLEPRNLAGHHHVRLGRAEDFGRLARHIAGKAVSVVLGGGGARGYAHIGVLRAMRELSMPIDAIAGTSMGAIIAAQFAMEVEGEALLELNHRMIALRAFKEYTLPLVAMLRCRRLEEGARISYGETMIEDLWLPFFAISSNLTTAEMVVHDRGKLRTAVRASSALPGIANPVIVGKSLLVDGAIVNNLPADVMRARYPGTVVGVNVTPREEVGVTLLEFPSPWRILAGRLIPFVPAIAAPGIFDILMRTTMLASTSRLSQTKRDVDLYLAPPVQQYTLVDFEAIDAIAEVGYAYAKEEVGKWQAARKA